MENHFTRITRYFLIFHVLIFIITLLYIISLNIIVHHYYMFDSRMPWQETFLNKPLKPLLEIQVLLYFSKLFLILPLVAIIWYRKYLKRSFYIYFALTCSIYLAIEFNLIHNLFYKIMGGYDDNNFSFDSSKLRFI